MTLAPAALHFLKFLHRFASPKCSVRSSCGLHEIVGCERRLACSRRRGIRATLAAFLARNLICDSTWTEIRLNIRKAGSGGSNVL